MENEAKVKYKGYMIVFRESSETWQVAIGDDTYENFSLVKVKKYIDNLNRKGFKRFDVFVSSGWGEFTFRKAQVTSVDEEGHYWVVYESGSREKVHKTKVYEYSKENINTMELIKAVDKKVEELHKERENYIKRMVGLK